jgi:hypothetical protein
MKVPFSSIFIRLALIDMRARSAEMTGESPSTLTQVRFLPSISSALISVSDTCSFDGV